MATTWLPCGVYHQSYAQDHSWFQTRFIQFKMALLGLCLFIVIPLIADNYWLSVCNSIGYTILGALGVQLLIGFCGQVTLGHAAFLAVGAYTSTLMILEFPWPRFMLDPRGWPIRSASWPPRSWPASGACCSGCHRPRSRGST
jgi:branched-chain amino acid transport system permease protein